MTKRNLEEQKKATAIRNILKGDNFSRKQFKDHWNDKDCFSLGVITNPYIIQHDYDHTRFTSWWNEWRWDGEYMSNLFIEIISKHGDFSYKVFPEGILEHLPDTVTNNIHFARAAAEHGINEYGSYIGEEIMNYPEEVICAAGRPGFYWVQSWFRRFQEEKHYEVQFSSRYEHLIGNPEAVIQAIENRAMESGDVPYILRRTNKKVAAAVIRNHQAFWGIPKAFLDDIPFALDCLGDNPNDNLSYHLGRHLSYRIRKLIGYHEGVPCLKTLLSYIHLAETVPEKNHVDSSTQPTARVNKI